MSSILKFLRDLCCCCCAKDPSDALFAAGVEAWKKYEGTRDSESQYLAASEAVRNHQAALDIRLPDHPRRPESLLHTAMALWAQCQGVVTKESSSTVIAYYDEALRLLLDKPDKVGRRATVHTNLGMVYFTLFRLGNEDRDNIGKAIENYRSALQLRPGKSNPDRPISLNNLSIALVQKGSKDDLMNAIIHLHEAVELCPTKPTDPRLLLLSLNNLAQAYDSHYNYSKDISDVVGKVDVLRRVVDLTNVGKGRLVPLINLTNALWTLCEIEHNRRNDLDEAVLRGREALKLSDGSDGIIHVKALTTLANVLSARYVQISPKNVADLDQSISYNQEALQTCPKDNPLYLRIQNNLGGVYLIQFETSAVEGDLIKAIQAYEEVVSYCPDDNADFTYYQETLKNAKRALEGRMDRLSVLTRNESISVTIRSRSSQLDSPSTPRSPTRR